MQDSQWDEAQAILLRLLDLPEDDRRQELEACRARDAGLAAWVERLLELDPGTELSDEPRRFGPYEAIRTVGHGGMGEVVVARRADGEYEHEVAIKILRGGATSEALVQRFLRERQTLAGLDHQYIAKLYDGGTTEKGEPYLVMEYVEGEPADAFAARLELPGRLELFVRICEAVAHAHGRRVVHRDLKPDNVLVRPDGTPRLLDFGIARQDDEPGLAGGAGPLTRTGHRLFTPEYASPEQVRGETATAQSDVFALGVLLYVFLCDEGPWGDLTNLHDLERAICETDPPPPSRRLRGTSRRKLSGDLDAVVLQCLEKRPSRRYESVDALRADIERHLAGRPVRARRTSAVERAARFLRRRPLVPIASSLMLVTAFASWAAWDAETRGERSRAELHDSVADRLSFALELWGDGERRKAFDELEVGLAAMEELPPNPRLESALLAQQAVFTNFEGDWETSLELIDRGERICAALDDPDPMTVAKLLSARTFVLQRMTPRRDSEEAAWAALEYAYEHLEPGFTLRTDALMHWAHELRMQGQLDEAVEVRYEAIAESRDFDPKGEPLARHLSNQAVALVQMGRIDEALGLYREALEILEWHHGIRNPSFATVRQNYARALFREGRFEEALPQFELALGAFRAGDVDVSVATNLHNLALTKEALGDLAGAEANAREAIEIFGRARSGELLDRATCLLGVVLARSGRPDEARPVLESILDEPGRGPLATDMEARARRALAAILAEAGDDDAAARQVERARVLESL